MAVIDGLFMMAWFDGLSPNVQAALIAAVVTLLGILIKDLLISFWQERKTKKRIYSQSSKDMPIHYPQQQQAYYGD